MDFPGRSFIVLTTFVVIAITVLLQGETGVGKEVFARTLHERSTRRQESFIAINCAAIPYDLVESELFGVEKGAYTGALASRPGRFERANGGTLFLDEIGDLPLSAQAKLLRVWHDHPETDEVFLVLKGRLEIQLRDGNVVLNEGEMFVVPKGAMGHRWAKEPGQWNTKFENSIDDAPYDPQLTLLEQQDDAKCDENHSSGHAASAPTAPFERVSARRCEWTVDSGDEEGRTRCAL